MTDEQPTDEVPDPPTWAQAPRPRTTLRRTAAEAVADADFPLALRGYDRDAVDRYVAEVSELVAELESARMRAGG
jgi:DivIVA domain-containing protein